MRVIFFDTETTGGADLDRIVQLAVKERSRANSAAAFVHDALYKPPVPISIDSMTVHHITETMVDGRPLFVDAPEYENLRALFADENTVAVAHNAAFDVAMLAREGVAPTRVICTYKVARALDPEESIGRYQLQYLRYFLGLDVIANAHDALGDCLVLEALFERLLAKMAAKAGSEERAIGEMIDISSQPLLFTTLRFGKHRGKRIEDVARTDRPYLEWLLGEKKKEPSAEVDWIHTLEHYLAKR